MNIRRKVILAVAMSFVMVVTVAISVVAASLAWQEWEKGQWEMAGIFAVAAAVFLSATFVLGYQMLSALRRKRSQPHEYAATHWPSPTKVWEPRCRLVPSSG